MARRRKKTYRRKSMIHPSLTSIIGTATIGKFLNSGYDPSTSVIKALQSGDFGGASRAFLNYAEALVTTPKGRTALTRGVAITVAGGVVRKALPSVKLGLGRWYLKI